MTSIFQQEKVYGGNDLPKIHVLSSEWKTERVRENASGHSEDGEEDDDELPCVIGESEGDCIWWGLWRLVGSLFHRQTCRMSYRTVLQLYGTCKISMQLDNLKVKKNCSLLTEHSQK